MQRRKLATWSAWIAVGALTPFCPAMPSSAAQNSLQLEQFFQGRLVGQGVFVNRRDGSRREFTAQIEGTVSGANTILKEHVSYSDGEHQTKVWTFKKIAEGRYIGHSPDVVGNVDVTQEGGEVRMSYTARVVQNGTTYNLKFDDRYIQQGPRSVINKTKVSYLFMEIGEVEATVRKV